MESWGGAGLLGPGADLPACSLPRAETGAAEPWTSSGEDGAVSTGLIGLGGQREMSHSIGPPLE